MIDAWKDKLTDEELVALMLNMPYLEQKVNELKQRDMNKQ